MTESKEFGLDTTCSIPWPSAESFSDNGVEQINPMEWFKKDKAAFVMNDKYMRCRASSAASSTGMPELRSA